MKFTIRYGAFLDMLKEAGKKRPQQRRGDKDVRITVCAPMVFVESNQSVVGVEAQVSENGQCLLERKPFVEIVKTFDKKDPLTIECKEGRLQIDSFSMGVKEWRTQAVVPANYVARGS